MKVIYACMLPKIGDVRVSFASIESTTSGKSEKLRVEKMNRTGQ